MLGREQGDDAVAIRDPGAQRDQGEHVEVARGHRLGAADEERPATPQHHRCRQDELGEIRQSAGGVPEAEMAAHLQRDDRQRQCRRDPEPPRHVGAFAARVVLGNRARFGLQRHAADRAMARPDLADFRMHRAGVDRAFGLAPAAAKPRCADIFPGRRRICRGSPRNRRSTLGRRGCGDGSSSPGRPSSRTPDRWQSPPAARAVCEQAAWSMTENP